ncbi:MAG: UDP-N-acetyl-2-amino-2-deoxy-D-glucuronate oxidase [Bacteroidota bacterium]
MIKTFAIMGAAGYVAVQHLRAIKNCSANLLAAFDPHDSVGVLDQYFPQAAFFTEFERFERHVNKLSRIGNGQHVEYISICTPNYLHDSHIRFSLNAGANAICEKPMVLNTWNLDALAAAEAKTNKKVFNILQLRFHPAIIKLKEQVNALKSNTKFEVNLTYISPRGNWYFNSWKGEEAKSGGIITNIGVHFFDMLHHLFGSVQQNNLHYKDQYRAGGFIEFEKARVRWFLSVNPADMPQNSTKATFSKYRALKINEQEIDFTEGFADLHTSVYGDILSGGGFGIEDARTAIKIVSDLRVSNAKAVLADLHPALHSYC